MRFFNNIINVVFSIAFFVHITFIAYFLKNPLYPNIKVYQQDFSKTEFPLSFKICLRELENQTEIYENLGYKNVKDFFLGASMFEEHQYGWNGHRHNNLTFASVKGLYIDCIANSCIFIIFFHLISRGYI